MTTDRLDYGSNVPLAREELTQIAAELRRSLPLSNGPIADRIDAAVLKMTRRKVKRRAPNTSAKITPELKAEVMRLFNSGDMSNAQIASAVNVNPARVSEILNGLQ